MCPIELMKCSLWWQHIDNWANTCFRMFCLAAKKPPKVPVIKYHLSRGKQNIHTVKPITRDVKQPQQNCIRVWYINYSQMRLTSSPSFHVPLAKLRTNRGNMLERAEDLCNLNYLTRETKTAYWTAVSPWVMRLTSHPRTRTIYVFTDWALSSNGTLFSKIWCYTEHYFDIKLVCYQAGHQPLRKSAFTDTNLYKHQSLLILTVVNIMLCEYQNNLIVNMYLGSKCEKCSQVE